MKKPHGPAAFPLALLALLAAPPALAADGRIPVSFAPCVIGAPGHYSLTQSLTTAAAGSATVTVSASDVDLDLNGYAIGNTGTGTTYGVNVGGVSDVISHNGSLSGANYLVY